MTASLKERIARHIKINGPLPLAEYMHWCLADKTHGYYQNETVFGREGDFVTAPEVSQMFGELIGSWLVSAWQAIGSPASFNLVELGPGNGTLMSDILRTTKLAPAFSEAMSVVLVETSERLIEKQRETLKEAKNVQWLKSIDEISTAPMLLVANEFLDALPFRQYIKANDKWREHCVGLDENGELTWVLGTGLLEQDGLPYNYEKEPDGAVFEVSTIRESFVERISQMIAERSGAALFIDYGHLESGFGDTFQAIAQHAYSDPLSNPGKADLTSHVDFAPFTNIASRSACYALPPLNQETFLLELGLLERAGKIGSGKSQTEQQQITAQAERLALPHEMGNLFKVFAISSQKNLWPFVKTE